MDIDMGSIILMGFILLGGAPIIGLIWFLVELVLYIKTDRIFEKKKKRRRNGLIIAAVVTVLFVLAQFGIWYVMSLAVAHM